MALSTLGIYRWANRAEKWERVEDWGWSEAGCWLWALRSSPLSSSPPLLSSLPLPRRGEGSNAHSATSPTERQLAMLLLLPPPSTFALSSLLSLQVLEGPSVLGRRRGVTPPRARMGGATLMLPTPSQLSREWCEGVACLRPRQAGRAREGRERGWEGGRRREGGGQRARIAAVPLAPSTPPGD